ncbi:MAG: exodeoxyribonuclease VII large subunit, partial [Phycisphaerae bacterium]
AFNEEPVARAIHASRIPIISAVGHEVDVTIADLVADVRAATPTAAAELAVPVLDDLLGELDAGGRRLTRAVHHSSQRVVARFDAVTRHVAFRRPLEPVHRRGQLVDELIGRMQRGQSVRLRSHRRRLDRLVPVIGRIAPHALLRARALTLRDAGHRLRWALARRMVRGERAVQMTAGRLDRHRPAALAAQASDRLRRVRRSLSTGVRRHLDVRRERLRRDAELLGAVGYRRVLGRGFSITRLKQGRAVVRSLEQLSVGQLGQFESDVVNLTQRELFD